jgi:hypothetical protein
MIITGHVLGIVFPIIATYIRGVELEDCAK